MASREYTSDGDRTRPIFKKKNYKIRAEKEGLEYALVLGGNSLHGFLEHFARRYFGRCGLSNLLDRGAPRFAKKLGGNGSTESGILSRTFGWSPQKLYLNTQHPYP